MSKGDLFPLIFLKVQIKKFQKIELRRIATK